MCNSVIVFKGLRILNTRLEKSPGLLKFVLLLLTQWHVAGNHVLKALTLCISVNFWVIFTVVIVLASHKNIMN